MKLTALAQKASQEMLKAQAITMNVQWDMQGVDQAFPNGQTPNQEYNQIAQNYIKSMALVKIVDAYQWYNCQIFKLLAKKDPKSFMEFSEGGNLSSADIKKIASGEDPIVVTAEKLSMRDSTVRKHLHKTLNFWEEEELSIMVEIRNCVTHHLGRDYKGVVREWIKHWKSPWQLKGGVCMESENILFNDSMAMLSAQIGQAQISIFDQMVAQTFGLEKADATPLPLKRSKIGKPIYGTTGTKGQTL